MRLSYCNYLPNLTRLRASKPESLETIFSSPRKGNENKLINQGAINTNCKPRTLRQALFKYTDLRFFFSVQFMIILRNFNNLSIT